MRSETTSAPSLKLCPKCKLEKALDAFHRDTSGKMGVHSNCKACRAVSQKRWRDANPEKALEKSAVQAFTRDKTLRKASIDPDLIRVKVLHNKITRELRRQRKKD